MFQDQRVIYDGQDVSRYVNDFRSGTKVFPYETDQYLYVGSIMPFNNLWIDLEELNTVTSSISIEIWWGNRWEPAVDIIDETNGLKETGRISWNTNRLKSWDIEQTTKDVTGLEAFEIYWRFWTRLSWSVNLTPATEIKYIGQKFADDDILYSYYPDLNSQNVKDSFEANKATWDEQHYMAAEHIIADLKKRNIIKSKSQIMDYSLFQEASCHKIAEMVYTAFGRPYFDQLLEARKLYKQAMDLKFYNVDVSGDGSLSPTEREFSTTFMRR